MRLTSLEIKGFKSFGDKISIQFDEGVTAIVGPNGSGKSNVVDAIRWVLGEQKTRMLRSEKMENIIFNGTKTRKPANLAEVSLSFENTKNILPTEFSHITITRKLYRTGDSEYLINNIACRLKDITDLFLDTGIGSDSYSIIELKMVDEIINDKNSTIKLLFEEAAGISKYKLRKKQTLGKLEDTEADLSRVNDLMFEIEKNLKTLESQAKKAERFTRLKETYKDLSTQVAMYSIRNFKKDFEALQNNEEGELSARLEIDTAISTHEALLENQKLDSLEKEKYLAASQKQLNELNAVITQHENEKRVKNERLTYLKDKEQSLENKLKADKETLALTTETIKNLTADNKQEQELLDLLEGQLKELKVELDKKKETFGIGQTELNNLIKEAQAVLFNRHDLEKNYAVKQTQKESLQNELKRIEPEKESLEKSQNEIKTNLDGLMAQLEAAEKRKLHGQEKLKDLEETINKSAADGTVLQNELIAENRKLDAKQNEYNLTKGMIDNLEGFPESIRFLKKNVPVLKKAPLLADIISCKQEFKAAIENYLEPFMSYFVVETVEEAQQSITLLNESAGGRAHFFVLSYFKNIGNNIVNDLPGCIHSLQIVETEHQYDSLMQHLLRNVYVLMNDQEDASSIQLPDDSYTLLSQNGKYVRTSRSLSGGSVGLFSGKRIGRNKNLEEIQKEIALLEKNRIKIRSEAEKNHEKLSKMKAQQIELIRDNKVAEETFNKLNNETGTLKNRLENLGNNISNNQKRIEEIRKQIQDLETSYFSHAEGYEQQLLELEKKYLDLIGQRDAKQEIVAQMNKELEVLNTQYNQQNIQYIQQKNKIDTIVRDLAFRNSQLENITNGINTEQAELSKSKEQILELVSNSEGTDDQLIGMYTNKSTFEKEVGTAETEYFKSRGSIDEIEGKIRDLRRKKEQADLIIQSTKEKVTEIKIQLNSLKERLNIEFNINIEDLMEEEEKAAASSLIEDFISTETTEETDAAASETEEEDGAEAAAGKAPKSKKIKEISEEEAKAKLEKVKTQIAEFGPVNPMAVEAYNEIKERHTFILQQQDDLKKAKDSLLQTIAEIDGTAKEKFTEAFVQIRENFILVFRSLFSEEDSCDLLLTETNDPLESDINIVAQPKGKRPLTINQLSGGEKTLTATALLFAIYLLKPAPFCIFDEVDAPLDDTNIDKFTKIIKKFSDNSQFIIITHNKRTMSSANILYGITMVEAGITQVVPVDLSSVEA